MRSVNPGGKKPVGSEVGDGGERFPVEQAQDSMHATATQINQTDRMINREQGRDDGFGAGVSLIESGTGVFSQKQIF